MKKLSVFIFLLCFPFLLYADKIDNKNIKKQEIENIQIKPYISLKLGYSNVNIKISEPTNKDFKNDTFSFNPAFGLKFDKKYLDTLSFRIEAEYFRNTSGKNKDWTIERQWRTGTNPYFTYHYETRKGVINTTINGLLLNTYSDLDINIFIKPYIVCGFGYGKITQENQLIIDLFNDYVMSSAGYSTEYNTYSEKHSTYNMFWQIGLGASFDITDNWSLNAEYRYIDYGSLKLYDLEYKYKANQFLIGVKYLF